jgi:putative hemolysin
MLADAVLQRFSRSQFEDELNRRNCGRLGRWFARPLLEETDACILCGSILHLCALTLYLIHGMGYLRAAERGTAISALILLAPLAVLVVAINLLGRFWPEQILVRLLRPLWVLTLPLRPVARLAVRLENRIESALHNGEEEEDSEERDDIIAAVTDGQHEGVVEKDEHAMIVNIFDLKNFDISDIMTPRTEICALPIDTPLPEAMSVARERGFSRIPVFEETRDNVRGIFYVKDALDLWGKADGKPAPIGELLRPAFFVPETKNVGELMRELQEKKTHLAVVLDEYGGTAGLVTIEDVVEEIVGEIQDEYDPEAEELLREVNADTFEVDARVHVHDMNEALNDRILPETDDFETVGGFVLDQLGHVPEERETFGWGGLRFTILSADERRIGRIRVERLEDEDLEEELPPRLDAQAS